MADNEVDAKAEKLQKKIDNHGKKVEACNKQLDKIGPMLKKALQAGKKIDQIVK